MEIIELKSIYDIKKNKDGLILVLGYFDGLHKGHKKLFEEAKKLAQILNLKIAVLTFPESPKLAFSRFSPDLLLHLSSRKDRLEKFEDYGVDYLYLTDFTSNFANIKGEDFVKDYLEGLGAKVLVAGFDYSFGHEKLGVDELGKIFTGKTLTVSPVKEELEAGENKELTSKVSSSRIRDALDRGNIRLANKLLGYHFKNEGLVVHGDARGRTLGYPTANIALTEAIRLPADGVYITDVIYQGETYRSMTSVGKNSTFDGHELRLEVNIFDFSGDLYGERIEIIWLDRIRDMVKFDGIDSLVAQLEDDEKRARLWDQ
ncbi:bifunctional riboflavin kinase/FAD synthetase [Streptococcaceae bacterium ESL0687]|nr:bifunctional riboflavin kinase/FAD synthetase [Streptococcaceae bacterium ESL0687]